MPNKNKGGFNNNYNYSYNGGGGYLSDQLKNLGLPQKLKCSRCEKWKDSNNSFSKKEQARARFTMTQNKPAPSDLKCMVCTGHQRTELKCIGCDETKGLEDFAKTHRRNPDNAKCKDCMLEQLAYDPDDHSKPDPDHDSDSSSDENADDSDDCDTEYAGSSGLSSRSDDVQSSIGTLSLDDSASTTTSSYLTSNILSSADMLNGSSTSGGARLVGSSQDSTNDGDWQTVSSTHRRVAASSATTSMTASTSTDSTSTPRFNPNAYGNPLRSSTTTPFRTNNGVEVGKSGWAKVKPALPKPVTQKEDSDDLADAPTVSAWLSDSDDD